MKPFLVTTLQAARMPRWLPLLLCALYIVPGLIGRDPWRFEDAEGFGIAFSMHRGDAGGLGWLVPNVAGEPVLGEGPLPFWLGAAAMRMVSWLAPWISLDAAFQGVAMLWLALMLAGVWYGTWLLAKRPEVQPADPFGASASRSDFGRAVADCALLVVLATFGLLARTHETTAEAAQIAWVGLFLWGCALALERPKLGGLLAGLAIGASLLSRGLAPALALAIAAAALPWISGPFRLVAVPFTARWLPVSLALGASWPLLLWQAGSEGQAHLAAWLSWNRSELAGPTVASLGSFARTAPWFFWPAWPLAAWAGWRWRSRLREPALAVPLLAIATLTVSALLAPRGGESPLLPLAPPLALLAALGLPTIRRGLVSLVDWFAVMTFTTIGFVLWAYWIAFHTGWPPRMAYRIGQSVLGFEPSLVPLQILLGAAATLAWLALVAWRVSRQPRAIWRPVLLSSGGMVLTWALLMTLWLPAGNHRKTYREPAQQAGTLVAQRPGCVAAMGLDGAQRASFAYFGGLRFGSADERCNWLLLADDLRHPVDVTRLPGDWALEWRGQRPVDRRERFRLLRRVD